MIQHLQHKYKKPKLRFMLWGVSIVFCVGLLHEDQIKVRLNLRFITKNKLEINHKQVYPSLFLCKTQIIKFHSQIFQDNIKNISNLNQTNRPVNSRPKVMKNINKRLIEQTKFLLKGQQADHHFIWQCMEDQEQAQTANVYYYCMKIFQSLINSQKKIDYFQNQQAMLSTLLILQFYKNMKEKHQSFLSSARELFSQNYMKPHQHAEWVIELFLKSSEESSFAKEFISRLCHAPKKITWKLQPGRQFEDSIQEADVYCRHLELQSQKQQKITKPLRNTSYPTSFLQSKILSTGYLCFVDYLRSANLEVSKEIYVHILDLVKGFVHAARVVEKVNELFINLMFLVKNLITFYGCNFPDILKQMAYWLTVVRNWTGIVAFFAAQLFDIIHAELKVKGTAFRKKIKMDFPSIDVKNAENLSKKVVLLSNLPQLFNVPPACSIMNLRKLFIYNTLACCDPENLVKNWKTLESIDPEATYNFYFKVCRLVELTMSIESYSELHALLKESFPELIKYNPQTKGKIPKDQTDELEQIVNHDHSLRFFNYPLCQIVQVKLQNFETKKYVNSLYQLFQNVRFGNAQLFYHNKVSLALMGDDYEIGRWLKTIIPFLEDLSIPLLQKLQIYLIPTKKLCCSIAEYIASKDLWYRRFVYNVFHQKIFFPDVEMKQDCVNIFPHYLWNKSLHMYIREAERLFPVQIFKCLLKINQIDQEEVVYFSSHILLGSSAEIEIMRSNQNQKQKKQLLSTDSIDIYLEKISKPPLLSIDLMISYKESLTKQSFKRSQKKLLIEDMQICNTPREYFMGNEPDPSDRFLEVSVLTEKMGKVWKRQLQNKDLFKRNNEHEIRQAFKDLFINMSADLIVIENLNLAEPLKVVIDGAATNKIDRITIMPVQNKDNYPVRLPIKTFLPFQV